MCAMIPMLRMRARGTSRMTGPPLPRISFGSAAISLFFPLLSSFFPVRSGAKQPRLRRRPPGVAVAGRRRRAKRDAGLVGGWGPATVCRRWPPTTRRRCPPVKRASPPVVGERSVALGHLLQIVLALDRGAEAVAGVHQLGGQPLGHRLLAALAGVPDDPPDREGRGPPGPNLDRHLVRCAADPAALH